MTTPYDESLATFAHALLRVIAERDRYRAKWEDEWNRAISQRDEALGAGTELADELDTAFILCEIRKSRSAVLIAERDRARDIAVRLEQELDLSGRLAPPVASIDISPSLAWPALPIPIDDLDADEVNTFLAAIRARTSP